MYLKLKQHPYFFILIGRLSKVFEKFKRAPIMLNFQYFLTEIKTLTSSLKLIHTLPVLAVYVQSSKNNRLC